MAKRILIVTPRFPYPEAGADEQDRAEGIRQFLRLGFEVRVVAKYFDWQEARDIQKLWTAAGVSVVLIPYLKKKNFSWILDGAAAEYADPAMQQAVATELDAWKPDMVCFDYTYLWPLYHLVRERHIPIAVRSINVESRHFLEEDGRTPLNYLKFIPKYFTEKITARQADVLFSITPYEEQLYRHLGAKNAVNLPLRALWKKLGTHTPRQAQQLHVFFAGSTYSVAHNRRALDFVVKELAPAMWQKHGSCYLFHIVGAKFPQDLESYVKNNVRFEGFQNMDIFGVNMDIAVVPSFFGAGMQQKIFEPLARGFPTITHRRGMADYDFIHPAEVILAESTEEFIAALEECASVDRRRELSENAKRKAAKHFSQEVLDGIVRSGIGPLLPRSS